MGFLAAQSIRLELIPPVSTRFSTKIANRAYPTSSQNVLTVPALFYAVLYRGSCLHIVQMLLKIPLVQTKGDISGVGQAFERHNQWITPKRSDGQQLPDG